MVSRRRVLGGSLAGVAGVVAAGAAAEACASHAGLPGPGGAAAPAPRALTVDGLAAPIGVGVDDVFFGWHLADPRRGAVQRGYRVVVSRPPTPGGARRGAEVVWDSGPVVSGAQAFVAYGGPALAPDTTYAWTVQTWASSGGPSALAPHATFDTGLRDGDWAARWISRPFPHGPGPDEYAYLRHEFRAPPARVVRARAYVSGDQQYELYVNGTRAGKGQAYSFPDSQYYETLDVTSLLRPGAPNGLAMVTSWQGATKGHPAGRPGAILQLSLLAADGTHRLVVTDGSWRVRQGAWLAGTQRDLEGDHVDFTENISGPDVPAGWTEPGYDDGAWSPAAVLGPAGTAPWRHLVPVRTRIVEEPLPAQALATLPTGAVVADFGKVYAAVPTVSFHRGTPGRLVTMHAGYLLDDAGPGTPGEVSTTHGTQHTDMSYSYVQRGGGEEFHPFDYLGFRYLQIDDPGEALAPADVVARTRHAAVPDEHAATFSSSSPTVDAVFELGRHSALFTAQEQFLDTPTREKGPWLWDGFNDSQTAMAAFGETNLTRKSLQEFAQSQRRFWPSGAVNKIYPTGLGALDINEFTEIYPEWVWQYWMHTADGALLAEVYPVLVRLAGYVAGALDPSSRLVSNLASTDIYYPYPVVTRLNILGVNVFRRTADAAAALGRPSSEVTLQRGRQARLLAALNRRLVRPDGLYVQGIDGSGHRAPVSQDPNACALAYEVVPPARRGAVAAYVARQGMGVAPRTATEVIKGLATNGRVADAVRILTDPDHDGWAHILARGGTFTWEVWEPSDANGDSMSHGWGSTVLVEIQRRLLGVEAAAPGFSSFTVIPPVGGVDHATGTVPTPRGTVAVSWQRRAAPTPGYALELTVPANAAAAVHLPASGPGAVTEGGRPPARARGVRVVSWRAGRVVLAVGAGHYQFRSTT